MDPSVLPKNRRMEAADFEREVERRTVEKPDDEQAIRYERLEWFINELLEASIRHLPRDHRRNGMGRSPWTRRPCRPSLDRTVGAVARW
jgi:hypothetical protein